MAYSVIGASFQQGTLAVFHAGLEDELLPTFDQACQKALRLLIQELAVSTLADIHRLHDEVVACAEAHGADIHQLNQATGDELTLSWYADDHFVINVMDETESFQLHLEVVAQVAADAEA